MSRLKTPDWILKGGKDSSNSMKSKKKQKTFKIRKCPKCSSDSVYVVLGFEEGRSNGEWECKKCKWRGKDIKEEELNEEEFVKYLDGKEK